MILSITIPTYNRASHLEILVRGLLETIESVDCNAEVVVLDNASTDATMQILKDVEQRHPGRIRIVSRTTNIGMEANITAAALSGSGKYTWLLSDHQTIDKEHFGDFLSKLESLEFDFAYARLGQWGTIIAPNKPCEWRSLTSREQGAFLFTLGNMSAFMFRTEHARTSAAILYRACYFGYPHLGVFAALRNTSVMLETDVLSYLPDSVKHIKYGYDVIPTRYRKNIECLDFVLKAGDVTFRKKDFFTRDYDRAIRGDSMNLLLVEADGRKKTLRSLMHVAGANRGINRMVVLGCVTVLLCVPARLRIAMADQVKRKLKAVLKR